MKRILQIMLSMFLGVVIYSCERTAPDYEKRIMKIGMLAIKHSENYDPNLPYRDIIADFGYEGSNLYKSLADADFSSQNASIETGKGELEDMYQGNRAGYYMKLIDKKTELWVRLRYDSPEDQFQMVNYITKTK